MAWWYLYKSDRRVRDIRYANLNSTTFPSCVDTCLHFDSTKLRQGRVQRQDVGMGRTQLVQQRVL